MSIEDIDYLKKNSVKETFLFIVDSKDRDYLKYPDPNYYSFKLNTPFKNVIGIEVIDYSIPRTMYSLDIYNNNLFIYIANSSNDFIVNNGLDPLNANMNIFTKFEMSLGNYNLLTFMPTFNSLMLKNFNEDPINYPAPIEIITYSNPPELTNVITFTCQKPFILNMSDSTLAETLGFSTNIRKEDDNIKYKYINRYENQLKFLKIFHSFYNSKADRYEITAPGVVFFIGEKYITIRSPEIEEHAYGSLAYNNYNLGIAKFKVNTIGFNEERFEIQKIPSREFHPIGKLSKLTFRFEASNNNLYDFKGVNHLITYIIYFYSPKFNLTSEFKSILNPNYKNNFNDYNSYNKENEEEEDRDDFSRDKLLEMYKKNELLYLEEEEEEEEEEEV
jgi:hypothetical protein